MSTEYIAVVLGLNALVFAVLWIVSRGRLKALKVAHDREKPAFFPKRHFATEFPHAFAAEDALTKLGYTKWSYA